MQEQLLAEKLSVDVPTAKRLRESVLSEYPKMREYVESQQAYPFDESRNSAPKMGCWGPGTINTFFGDRLYLREWDYLKKAKDDRERNSIKAKIQRLAVNLVVQGPVRPFSIEIY
jgi:DNA polymerase I-like protein with 3'-5' exonuclease and polymerase domains